MASSIFIWSIGILLLEEYLSREESSLFSQQKMVNDEASKKIKKKNINVHEIDLIDERLFKKRKSCKVCFVQFGFFKRQYHCYVCAGSVCWDCSTSSISYKKSCDVCFYQFSNIQREITKGKILSQLKNTGMIYIRRQREKQAEIVQKMKKIPNDEVKEEAKRTASQTEYLLQVQLEELRRKHERLLQKMEQLSSEN